MFVSSFGPATAPLSGGVTFTISGYGLAGITGVNFGGNYATGLVNNGTTITGVVPAYTQSVYTQPVTVMPGAIQIGTIRYDPAWTGPPVTPQPPTTTPGECVRKAWLTLPDGRSAALESYEGGWFCSSLDIGMPAVREVVSNKPDRSGVDDRTSLMGSRAVTAQIAALTGAGAQIDAVAASFAPFMDPAARPVLHYVLDRPGAAERLLTLRAADYGWPVAGAYERDIQLQWVAPDPVAYDAHQKTATVWAGTGTLSGRAYPLTFNRIYPAGGGQPTWIAIENDGDLMAWPLYRIYGPITGPFIQINSTWPDSTWVQMAFYFRSTFTIGAGHWVDVDSNRRTALMDSDPTQNVINQIDWASSGRWPGIYPAPVTNAMRLSWVGGGGGTSAVTQAQAIWSDPYLT